MAKQLDFIIFGVPRSGTKALVRALNLHPHVYCAMERFHFRADHAQITFPESFLATSAIRDADDLAKVEYMRGELDDKREVRYAGNKLPRYYFALDRINREVPKLKNIWIYRSPYGFMPSWNRRELDKERGQWPAGQVGLFGLIELLVCIENSLKLDKDVFVFSYAHGLARSAEATLEALDFLGADPKLHDQRSFDKKQRLRGRRQQRRSVAGSHSLPLQEHEEELLDALKIRELDQIMEQGRGLIVSEIARSLEDFLARSAEVLPDALDRAFAASDNHAVASFGRDYVQRNRTELAGMIRLAQGSKALARFQRFGPYERLKSVYVQRWALRRRFAPAVD